MRPRGTSICGLEVLVYEASAHLRYHACRMLKYSLVVKYRTLGTKISKELTGSIRVQRTSAHVSIDTCAARHGELDGLLPDLFQILHVARLRRSHLYIYILIFHVYIYAIKTGDLEVRVYGLSLCLGMAYLEVRVDGLGIIAVILPHFAGGHEVLVSAGVGR